jgi:hypothetical protein
MLRFLDRPVALPLNLIWGFETTSRQFKVIHHLDQVEHPDQKFIGISSFNRDNKNDQWF